MNPPNEGTGMPAGGIAEFPAGNRVAGAGMGLWGGPVSGRAEEDAPKG